MRTSAYWGLEENYAIITALSSILFLLKFSNFKNQNTWPLFLNIFLVTFFSSLTIYFDQKFLIIPLICFFKIIFSTQSNLAKSVCIGLYSIFSVPYLFLIKIWGGIFPSNIYHIGNQFYFHHFGYAVTMIAFIFFPFIFIKFDSLKLQIFKFLDKRKILFLSIPIIVYLIILIFFYDDNFFTNKFDGGGIVKKISLILFSDIFLTKIFICLAIVVSWFFLFFFNETNILNFILTTYFLLISVIIRPFYQEYFDPIIFLLVFFIFKINFKLSFNKIYFFIFIFLFFYWELTIIINNF